MIGRPLPDLPAVVRRLQRRRHGRSAGDHRSIWTTWSGWASTGSGSHPSRGPPTSDWGYDVSDFCAIEPDFGTLEDVDRLIAEAGARGIRVLMDLVPNHTSDQHPWFLDSRSSRRASKRDWYVWADPKPDGSPPNNWVSSFGGPAWTADPATGQSYLHNHLAEQPDLNWWNEDVRLAFDEIMRFWCDRGVAGFRIDVCNVIIKDAELRDNPVATEDDDFEAQLFGQRSVYNTNRPEVHEVIRRWRTLVDGYDEPRILFGETPVPVHELAAYYGDGRDELHLAFNFPFISAAFECRCASRHRRAHRSGAAAGRLAGVDRLEPRHVPLSHPLGGRRPAQGPAGPADAAEPARHAGALSGRRDRARQRQGGPRGHARSARRSLLSLLRRSRRRPDADALERCARRGLHRLRASRPGCPWGTSTRATSRVNGSDPTSVLALTRRLIALRREAEDLRTGSYRPLDAPDGVWAWRRGAAHFVVLNMTDELAVVSGLEGQVRLSTVRPRDGEMVPGELEVAPWEGVIGVLQAPWPTAR